MSSEEPKSTQMILNKPKYAQMCLNKLKKPECL